MSDLAITGLVVVIYLLIVALAFRAMWGRMDSDAQDDREDGPQ